MKHAKEINKTSEVLRQKNGGTLFNQNSRVSAPLTQPEEHHKLLKMSTTNSYLMKQRQSEKPLIQNIEEALQLNKANELII